MFVGRYREYEVLNQRYESDNFEFVVMYGRRRVGKTALIQEFVQDKKAIYFMGVESNAKQNLDNFSRSILECELGISADMSFASFQAALEYVFQRAREERLILAIDEYPYVARAEKSLASTLQLLIDRYKDESKLMLILCGSSMSYMEDQVLAYKAPLYGRRTAQMKLLPFDFADACRCFPGFSDEEKALLYAVAGGTPQYLLQMKENLSVEENIKNTFLNPSSSLFEEPENLLKQEVREPALYNAIIAAIAGGASRMNEIAGKVGEETSLCSSYLRSLMELGLVQKELPYGEKTSKRAIYRIEDNMFRFWYRFVPNNSSMLARGAADLVYKRIEPHFSDHMGRVFEEICKQYLWQLLLAGESPVEFQELGRWWGTNPATRTQAEIDIMGEQDADTALFAECKWTKERVEVKVLESLLDRSRIFRYGRVQLFLFSKSGFTESCVERAKQMGNVSLVSFEEMMERIKKQLERK